MTPQPDVTIAAWELLTETMAAYRDSPRATALLSQQLARRRQPLRIAVAGSPGSGKSTLVNAVLGQRVAPVVASDAPVPAWYADGPVARAAVRDHDGAAHEVPVTRYGSGPAVDLGGWRAEQLDHVEVQWPARTLRGAILLDTPALQLAADDPAQSPGVHRIAADADAIVYLARQPHGADLPVLQAWQEGPGAAHGSVHTLLVLARADQVSGGRIDALTSARRDARRYRQDPRLRSLCQHVVAVSGLLAEAGRTLADPEFDALAALAAAPRAETERALLSADRFAATDVAIPAERRASLLARFGVTGIRLATTLIRQGHGDRAALAAELVSRSGLPELREGISAYLVARTGLLKARAALVAVHTVLRAEPRPESRALAERLERAVAGAHAFRELRLVAALQTGRLALPPEWQQDALRLAGADGTAPAQRLGLDREVAEAELVELALAAVARWQDRAADQALSTEQRAGALAVVCSCEAMLASVSDPAVSGQ